LDLNSEYSILLHDELISKLPPNGLTERNLKYYKVKLRASLSKVMRDFRRQLEVEKKEFKNTRFLILKRAENLSKQDKKCLEKLLCQFSFLERYRSLSLRISDIYHILMEKLKENMILGVKLWDDAEDELKTAVKTLKKNVKEMLNFRLIIPGKNKEIIHQKIRSSPEYSMRKIKKVVKNRYRLRSKNTWQLYLENLLKYPIIVAQT